MKNTKQLLPLVFQDENARMFLLGLHLLRCIPETRIKIHKIHNTLRTRITQTEETEIKFKTFFFICNKF